MQTIVQLKQRGAIIIPEPLRKALDLKEGDILEIDVKKVQLIHETATA